MLRLAVALAGLCLATVHAGIEWETTELEYEVKPQVRTISGSFAFANTGARAVRITSVQTTCGCTTADLAQRVYDPGQKGQVDWDMRIPSGNIVRKHIVVRTDDPDTPRISLAITVTRPQVVRVSQRVLAWEVEQPAQPITVDVKAASQEPVHLREMTCNRDGFDLQWKTIEEGRHYQLTVTPKSTAKLVYAMIELQLGVGAPGAADTAAVEDLREQLYARILRRVR